MKPPASRAISPPTSPPPSVEWRLWRRAGIGRGITPWQAAAFNLGLLTVFIALISPLEAAGGVLISAHMLQHVLLMMVAAPLLMLGATAPALAWALPESWLGTLGGWRRRSLWQSGWYLPTLPPVVWALYAGVLALWHLPALYQAALRSDLVHALEHGTFFGVALLD